MKVKYIVIACLLCTLLLPQNAYSQCGGEKPDWAKNSYHETLDNSYLESVVTTGMYFDDTRRKGEEEIERRRKGTVGEQNAWVKSKLAEYWECSNNGDEKTGYFLYQTLKNPTYKYEDLEFTDKYPFSAGVFVPGLAQIHKGSKSKGIFFIAGEIALVGGVVVAESLKASYKSKISSTHDAKSKQNYITKADNMGNVGNVLIAGAAALYVWNVIDGIAAKGKKHVVVLGNNNFQITPFAAPDLNGRLASGMTLSFKF
ncbi:hypothetical protein AGMMS49525_16840 [Bacteroidia bacterium]|nr:hypothetical protein AGMMS49525_16840 [Bacteroidia bacterium]